MKEVNANAEALKRNFLELTELKHILRKTQTFFEEVSDLWQFKNDVFASVLSINHCLYFVKCSKFDTQV